ncbi:small ribosomal subunit protein mS23 [Brachyhypopomus gauderio]|uniref:small ribosomal subunit protein mS23 n=1 Tax=Brachyhypopomus gauderio TaxID=698409 RepID=UPI004042A565
MAGSRLQKYGTVFTRVRDLMRAGVIKQTEKPLWFDVYAAFPPSREPLYVKPVRTGRRHTKDPVPDILYEEDQIRAKFFELYGSGPKAFDLTNSKFVSTCQRFVEMYSRLASRGDVDADLLLEQTGRALLAEGVVLRRKGRPAVAAKTRDPVLDMKLADMLTDTAVTTSASEELPQTVNTDSSTAS